MLNNLKILKKSSIWLMFIEKIFYPLYHFFWSYIINFKGKIFYFLWFFKKKDFFSLNNNDKLIVKSTIDSKNIANKILDESKLFIDDTKKELLSNRISIEKSKKNLADGEIPYRISIYEKLSGKFEKRNSPICELR